MNRYPTRNPFAPLVAHAVRVALSSSPAQTANATALVPAETEPQIVDVDPATGATTHPFELNSDVLNDPNARLFSL